jgi:hypothetical protein
MGQIPLPSRRMALGYLTARLLVAAIVPGAAILFLFLIALGGNPTLYLGIGVVYAVVVVLAIGLIFGFDATRQDIVEDLMGEE